MEWIVNIAIVLVSIILFIIFYRKMEGNTEKIVYCTAFIAYMALLVLYYLDRYNIPTYFGWNENVSPSDWLSVIGGYIAAILSTVISGIILVLITKKQLDIQKEKDKEDKRLSNMPCVNYELSSLPIHDSTINILVNPECAEDEDVKLFSLYVKCENIGLNHIRKICIKIKGKDIIDSKFYSICNHSFLKKDNHIWTAFLINAKCSTKKRPLNSYKIQLQVIYQDMLLNNYEQFVDVNLELTNMHDYYGDKFIILSKNISIEKIVEKYPDTVDEGW